MRVVIRHTSAETTINRQDFGLTWNALLETGGAVVSDTVKVSLYIAATRNSTIR